MIGELCLIGADKGVLYGLSDRMLVTFESFLSRFLPYRFQI